MGGEIITTQIGIGMWMFAIAFVVSSVATPLMRRYALARGWVHRPDERKWQAKRASNPHPITLLGGVSMWMGFTGGMAGCAVIGWMNIKHAILLTAFGTCALMLGIRDDRNGTTVRGKIAMQTAIGLLSGIFLWRIAGLPFLVGLAITVFVIIAAMNSYNLMDNMDGIAAVVGGLSGMGFAVMGVIHNQMALVVLGSGMAGICLAFLIWNFPPAKIFMGDGGSMFAGYILGVMGVLATHGRTEEVGLNYVIPLLILGVLIADTLLVMVDRKRRGVPIVVGGKDHIAHRLAAVMGGFKERRVIGIFALVQVGLISIAIWVALAGIIVWVVIAMGVIML
ncbi:MAG TPA: undecaprenyl/decaprenyl-phosphate alpha-N-acetylglucosaminyl 1-phosphate transferase, partial [Armatimonadetes bacterium]|nr:undecaprenyl/decaprenyl-phosphate alpha-N-acetylglucosaminyl 1-phosphate transferase [Armatimonadota bacterium]